MPKSFKYLILFLLVQIFQLAYAQNAKPSQSDAVRQLQATIKDSLLRERSDAELWIQRLEALADTVDKEHWIGTDYNELDSQRHGCYVLGQLLSKAPLVAHLKFSRILPKSPKTPEDAANLRIRAQSLENFKGAVDLFLKKTNAEYVRYWNLDCSGSQKIPYSVIEEVKSAAFFILKNNGETLQILGEIEAGFSSQLLNAINKNPKVKTIALGSQGGAVNEAIRAGLIIREKGLSTTLWNNCYSACPLVFLGGNERKIWSPYPKLGFHQIYTQSGLIPVAVSFTDHSYIAVANYIRQMGASSEYVVWLMKKAPPEGMHTISLDEKLCTYKVATWIQRFCDLY
jgi:hypothetical protein